MAVPNQAVSNDEQAIRDVYAQWRTATLAEDIPALLTLIADDAIFYVRGQQPMHGKQDFVEAFEVMRATYQVETRSEFDEIVVHGDWAHVSTRLAIALSRKDNGAKEFHAGHTLTILHKERGRWVMFRAANMLAPEPT